MHKLKCVFVWLYLKMRRHMASKNSLKLNKKIISEKQKNGRSYPTISVYQFRLEANCAISGSLLATSLNLSGNRARTSFKKFITKSRVSAI